MKLKYYLYKKNLIISITASIIYSVIIVLICWGIFSYYEKTIIENKKEVFKEFIRLKLANGNIILRNIKNNREINIYLKEGVMLDAAVKKIKVSDKWYYHYSSNSINKYKISTLIKNAAESNEDYIIDIYTYKGEPKIKTSSIPINMELLKDIDTIHEFGEINYIYIDEDKNGYIQFYGQDISKEHIIVMNMKITSNFVYEAEKIGVKIVIADDKTGECVISSFFGSEKAEKLNNPKEIKLQNINGEQYNIFEVKRAGLNIKEGYHLYILEKSSRKEVLKYSFFGIMITITILFINIAVMLANGSKECISIIDEIEKKIKGKEGDRYKNIEEYQNIVSEIEKFIKTKEEHEKVISKELEEKNGNIISLYNRIKMQNNFLKNIASHEKIEEILFFGYKYLTEITNVKEIKFATNMKGENDIKIIRVMSEGKIEEGYEKINGIEEFLKESEKIKIENENGGIICLMFKTDNIAVGILSIYYETGNLKSEDSKLLSELAEMLIVSLRSAKFYEMSMKDSLTGIYNRNIMSFYLKKMMDETRRYEEEVFSVLMIDIDEFKRINDIYGHVTGDFMLKRVVGDISKYIRDVDTMFRYGGEEFVVIMPKIDKKGAYIVAERIRKQIEEGSLKLDKLFKNKIDITVSIGVAQFNKGIHKSVQDIIAEADEKMYSAKRNGKNRCEM